MINSIHKFTRFLYLPLLLGILAAGLTIIWQQSQNRTPPTGIKLAPEIKLDQVQPSPLQASIGPVSYADAVAKAAPAVVNIYSSKIVTEPIHPLFRDPFFRRFFRMDEWPSRKRLQSSLGSGVIVHQDGYLLTNNHVIAGADEILVALQDGREAEASVVGVDPDTDLAVLKIELSEAPSINLTSSQNLRVGDIVLAIGNPFGVGQTVTMGIVSAKNRSGLQLSTYENFIQTDAAINPGNSGGALINAYGQLIGINTAIFSQSGGSQGIGFAVPSQTAYRVLMQIIELGQVVRGWLGIYTRPLSLQERQAVGPQIAQGILVAGLFENSPAHQAGVQVGDVLLTINGMAFRDEQTTRNLVANLAPGGEVTVKLWRRGQVLELPVLIGKRPQQPVQR